MSNQSGMDLYKETIDFEWKLGIVIPCIFAIIVLIGIVGNTLVVLVIMMNRSMKNSTNSLILSLAVSDLLFLAICVPFTAADYALPTWDFPDWWCGLLNYAQYATAYATVWTLVLMSVDRFLAVVYPVRSLTLRSTKNTTYTIVAMWTVILLCNLPVFFEFDVVSYTFFHENRSVCTYVRGATRKATQLEAYSFYISFGVFGYLFPLGLTVILYCFFLRKLWSMTRPGAADGRRRLQSLQAKRRVTTMIAGVIVTFALCWLPLNVCFFITAYFYPLLVRGIWFVYFRIGAQVLAYTNSCLNPILYAFLSETFRTGFVHLLQAVYLLLKCKGRNALKSHLRMHRAASFYHTTANGGKSFHQSCSKTNSAEAELNKETLLCDAKMASENMRRKSERVISFNIQHSRTATFSSVTLSIPNEPVPTVAVEPRNGGMLGKKKRTISLDDPPSRRNRKISRVLHSADFDIMLGSTALTQLSQPKIILTEFDSDEFLDLAVAEIEVIRAQV